MSRNITLKDLPTPSDGQTGWPWTIEPMRLPASLANGRAWPKISIVTPSYNQGQFIEETIRSVLLQGYPNLEYIIIDGGSVDQTVEIIRKYERWITYWVSEKDRGQSEAINKGFSKTTGEWGNWLNSDDILTHGALSKVAESAQGAPSHIEAICFGCDIVSSDRQMKISKYPISKVNSVWSFLNGGEQPMAQPSTFARMNKLHVDENLHFAMDWCLYFSMIEKNKTAFEFMPDVIAEFRVHEKSKTSSTENLRFLENKIDFLNQYIFELRTDEILSRVWVRRCLARTLIAEDDADIMDCLSAIARFPEICFDRMFLGRIRRIFQKFGRRLRSDRL